MQGNAREQIIRAFMELIEEKEPGKITVTDIVERCGITRKTFYYHFRDIFDLIEVLIERRLEHHFSESAMFPALEDEIAVFLKAVLKDRKILERIAESPHYRPMLQMMTRNITTYFYRLLDKRKILDSMPKADGEMLVHALTCAVIGLVVEEVPKTDRETEQAVRRLLRLFKLDFDPKEKKTEETEE